MLRHIPILILLTSRLFLGVSPMAFAGLGEGVESAS